MKTEKGNANKTQFSHNKSGKILSHNKTKT